MLRVRCAGAEIVLVPPAVAVIGRDANCDITVAHPQVSHRHLAIQPCPDGGWVARDLRSRNGTFSLEGRIDELQLRDGDPVRLLLGDRVAGLIVELDPVKENGAVRAAAGLRDDVLSTSVMTQLGRLTAVHELRAEVLIGRAPECDLVLDDLQVSRRHARFRLQERGALVEDLASHNGTFVNGTRVDRAEIREGDLLSLGGHVLELAGGQLREYDDHGAAWLLARDLNVTVDDRAILDQVSFPLAPSSLLAVVGPSGAGKSTLLNALTGFRSTTTGSVIYGGRAVHGARDELRSKMAYVPQDDVLHPQLRVRRALQYAAELRFPPDVDRATRERRVDEVLEELGLTDRGDLQISKLSGGQRKRVSVGLELLTKPSLLFLDEPTSGLDPGHEEQVMRLLRDLADGERTIVVVTHSLQSLDLCDRVLFLAPGGVTAYFGEPDGVLGYFADSGESTRFPEVFRQLDERREVDWAARFRAHADYEDFVAEPLSRADGVRSERVAAGTAARHRHMRLRQLRVLTHRYASVLISDRRNLMLLALQAPFFGMLYALLIGSDRMTTSYGSEATMLLWLLIVGATWLGTANAIREVVKERSILRREMAVGVSPTAYVVSKLAVLVPITLLQTTLLVLVAMAWQRLPPRDPTGTLDISPAGSEIDPQLLELIIGVSLAGIAALALGLLVSCLVRSSDRALVLLPLILIAQVVVSVPFFEADSSMLRGAGTVSSAQWGMSAVGSTLSLNDLRSVQISSSDVGRDALFAESPAPVKAERAITAARNSGKAQWRHEPGTWLTAAAMLALISATCVLLSLVILRRPDAGAPGREAA